MEITYIFKAAGIEFTKEAHVENVPEIGKLLTFPIGGGEFGDGQSDITLEVTTLDEDLSPTRVHLEVKSGLRPNQRPSYEHSYTNGWSRRPLSGFCWPC